MPRGSRLAWIEAARTISCILVVLVHVNIYTRAGMETWWPGGIYGSPPFALAVPTFLIIAGYAVDMGSAARGLSRRDHMLRLRRLAIPFVIWNAITLVVVNEPRQSNWDIVVQLLTGTWHLYFIFALLQLLLIYALVVPILERGKVNQVTGAALAVTLLAFVTSEVTLWSRIAVSTSFEIFARQLFVFWIGFFFIGVWWRRRGSLPIRLSWKLVLVVAATWILLGTDLMLENETFGFTSRKQLLLGGLPFKLAGSISLLLLLQRLDQNGNKIVAALASYAPYTFGIYLCHVAIMVLLFRFLIFSGLNTAHWAQVPLLTAVTFLISLAGTYLGKAVRRQISSSARPASQPKAA